MLSLRKCDETAIILPGHRECGWRPHDTPACEQPILRQVQQQNLVEPLEGDQEASLTDSCTRFQQPSAAISEAISDPVELLPGKPADLRKISRLFPAKALQKDQ